MTTTEEPLRHLGTPEDAEWFRVMLKEIGETQSSLARLMERNGDDRKAATILRNIQRMANGEARVSGEMRVILTMISRAQKKRAKAAAVSGAPDEPKLLLPCDLIQDSDRLSGQNQTGRGQILPQMPDR
jgi:hypothetical protein